MNLLTISRGRGFAAVNPFQSRSLTSLDNRPKRLCVSGYELEDKDELIRHFMVRVESLFIFFLDIGCKLV